MRKALLFTAGAVVLALSVATLLSPASDAAPGLWPNKRGELCWLDDEGNTVRAYTIKTGGNHYLFHGAVLRSTDPPPYDVHPFDGNVELTGSLAIGHVVQSQINDVGTASEAVEGFAGLFWIDVFTLEGTAEGVNYRCDRSPVPTTDCELWNNGPVTLTPIDCP